MKKLFLVSAVLIVGSVFLQSCKNEENVALDKERVEYVKSSTDFQQLMISAAEFKKTIFTVISAMSSEEQEFLFQNFRDESVMTQFLTKDCLTAVIINVQKSASRLLRNPDFSELQCDERLTLLKYHRLTVDTSFPQNIYHARPRLRKDMEQADRCLETWANGFKRSNLLLLAGYMYCYVLYRHNPQYNYDFWRWCNSFEEFQAYWREKILQINFLNCMEDAGF